MTFAQAAITAIMGAGFAHAASVSQLVAVVVFGLIAWRIADMLNPAEKIDDAIDRGLERFSKRYRK